MKKRSVRHVRLGLHDVVTEKAEAKSKQSTYYEGNNDKYINVVIL